MRILAGSVLAMAAMPLVSADAVLAQGAGAACFEVIPARANIEPPVPIMIDKCSGRSWVLIRNGRSYRWALIATDLEKAKTADRAPVDGAAAAPDSGSQKCFTFNNRKFCE
jgi:hypothetical protein